MKKKNTKSNRKQHLVMQGLADVGTNKLIFVPMEKVISKILLIRKKKVMLDRDLAELYNVKTIALRQAVKRNLKRFPSDFMFQLNDEEAKRLVSQNVIPSKKHLGGFLPYVFTEQGVAMLSSILNSERAILVNIQIIRTFTKLREMLATNKELREKIEKLERKNEKNDYNFKIIFQAIQSLLKEEKKSKK
jgi:hypothetical protein